ncbi:HD-GYP domain-containing protein [Treponema sp. J25]|uniref:HD-GYP domain-containing protein n=1 Tax=Treponema sp. J25 TaxID=2094121 RepID=UPI001042DFF7|nr:HD-GYP domain-containing protein [Treponema sp. J25]TCW61145.1 phosphohydrolase [Treponema sp. J25]
MKKVPLSQLNPGIVFTEPVYIQDNHLFVAAGVPVKPKELERLKAWGIDAVYTNGDILVPPQEKEEAAPSRGTAKTPDEGTLSSPQAKEELSSAKRQILSLPEVLERSGAYKTYTNLIEKLSDIFETIAQGLSVNNRSIDTITDRLLELVRENSDQVVTYILAGEITSASLAKSSVNTAILAAMIAEEMKIPNVKILTITTGALLHDIGMLRVPREILEKKENLTTQELQRIQVHPLYGYKIIVKELLYSEEVGRIALQHHERWDGEGYPRRLSGEAIDIGARIVSVCDAFEAMVSEKPYRNSMIGYQAMKNLLSDNGRRFDPEVLKAFIKTMGIYPIGSLVLINNGALARVIDVHGDAPLRPKLQILIDEFGKAYKGNEGEVLDLLTEKSLFIVRAINPKEIENLV